MFLVSFFLVLDVVDGLI